MKLRTAALVTFASLALAALPAAAQGYGPPGHGPGGGPGMGGPDHILQMAKELDLTDAQTAQITAITEKRMPGSAGDAMDSMREAREALAKTIHDANATDDQVRGAASVVAALDSQLAVQRHQMIVEIAAVLTPAQKTKLADLMANMKERHQGPPPGGPGGL